MLSKHDVANNANTKPMMKFSTTKINQYILLGKKLAILLQNNVRANNCSSQTNLFAVDFVHFIIIQPYQLTELTYLIMSNIVPDSIQTINRR